MAQSKCQGQGQAHFILSQSKCQGQGQAHFILAQSKCQGQGQAHFGNEHFWNGDRYGKDYYCPYTASHELAFDWHVYTWP